MQYFDPGTYNLHNANRSWSYTADDNQMRFEVRAGDHWNNRLKVERSEVASFKKLQFGHTYTINYKFMIEPGPINTADWLVIGQTHSTEDAYDAGVSPPFEINLVGDRMKIGARWSTQAETNWSNVTSRTLYTDTANIKRGHWYDIKITIKLDPFGGGMLDFWRDGVQLVNYDGPLGYNDQIGPYWKQGIYREASAETLAANYRDFSLVEAITGGAGNDILQGTAEQDSILGGNGRDTLYGKAGNDFLNGQAGNDFLNGQAGNDTLSGGSGDDVLHGLEGNDRLYGDDGNDRLVTGMNQNTLTGGNGADVFDFNALDQKPGVSSWIKDFQHHVDRIDLADIDANTKVSGNQAFTFIGKNAFSGHAGELRFSSGVLSADVNGDKVVDFHVRVSNAVVSASDLVL
ncbi:MAG TPA: heparin lyase I family protein [Microvirga sp.]|nr:heparin lyase I family protein [Microvirga sp.]